MERWQPDDGNREQERQPDKDSIFCKKLTL